MVFLMIENTPKIPNMDTKGQMVRSMGEVLREILQTSQKIKYSYKDTMRKPIAKTDKMLVFVLNYLLKKYS